MNKTQEPHFIEVTEFCGLFARLAIHNPGTSPEALMELVRKTDYDHYGRDMSFHQWNTKLRNYLKRYDDGGNQANTRRDAKVVEVCSEDNGS